MSLHRPLSIVDVTPPRRRAAQMAQRPAPHEPAAPVGLAPGVVTAADVVLVLRVRGLRRRLRWCLRVVRAVLLGAVVGTGLVFFVFVCLR